MDQLTVCSALSRSLQPPEKSVIEAARYSLFAGGKRLRPILCLASAEVVGVSLDAIMPVAAALEMIHTYSLIHDDLPAMDNDDYRRGQLTNHKVFGEAIAILAGDALLTEAFDFIASIHKDGEVAADKILQVIRIVVKASGYRGMIGGQVIDLESETREVDITTVDYMHIRKTGALISASLEIGGILGGGAERQVAALKRYGHHLGFFRDHFVGGLVSLVTGDRLSAGSSRHGAAESDSCQDCPLDH